MPLSRFFDTSPGGLQAEMRVILNAVVEGIIGVDAEGNATFCNESFLRMIGYRADELIGTDAHALIHHGPPDGTQSPEDQHPEDQCPLRKALRSKQPIHAEREFYWRKDGTCFPVECWVHPLPQPSGNTVCVITVLDITEREQATEALRTSEERLRQISYNINQAFYLVDLATARLVYVSPAFETITGFSCEEARSKPSPWRDLALPEHREKVRAGYERLLAGKEAKDEYQIRHRDGSTRWIKDHANPIRDANGQVVMCAGVVDDVTEIHQAREVLRQSEEKFRRILASIPDVAWTSDRSGRMIYISPKVELILGYSKQELCAPGTNLWLGQIHPEDFGRVRQAYDALFEAQTPFDQEHRIRRKDGAWVWVHDRATGVHEENGVLYVDGVLTDITERKQAEAELQWKTAFLEAQANCTIDGILVVDGKGRRLLHNQRLLELLQLPADQSDRATLKHTATLTTDPESFIANINRLNKCPGETRRDEIQLKDGRILDYYSAPVVGKDGTSYGRIWAFRDVTERKRAETELRLTQFAVEHASDAIERLNREGHLMYVNKAGCRDLGYSLEELLSMSVWDIDPSVSKEGWQDFWSKLKARRSLTFAGEHKTKQGRIFPVEITANCLEFDGQEYILAFARNVAERRALESQLRQAQKLEGIGQLAAGIAHEINTPAQFVSDNTTFLQESSAPLLQLLSLAQDLRREADAGPISKELLARFDNLVKESDLSYLEKEIPKALEQSLDGLKRISKIVKAMKEFSHPGSREKVATDLNRAIETTITVARNEWKYVADLKTEFDTALPLVPCLQGEFNQVILNLIVNAAQAIAGVVGDGSNGKGTITIATRRAEQSVEVTIRDTGPGIPDKIHSRIFEPFFTTKPVGKGTGQGLSMAHSAIVKHHQGRIWFETEVGKGTTFFVQLPLQVAAATGAGE